MGRVEGKVAFITGGARGLGRATALALAREGADVAVLDVGDRDASPGYPLSTSNDLEAVCHEIRTYGRRALALVGDVRDEPSQEAALKETVRAFGRIDVLVCNAGIALLSNAWEISEREWDLVLDVNLKGAWLTCKHAIPSMIGRRSGRIILIASGAGLKGVKGFAHYCASKFGVVGLGKVLAIELAPYGIAANVVCPGSVKTGINQGMAQKMGVPFEEVVGGWVKDQLFQHLLDPQDIANAVLWLASDEARNVTGITLPVDGGSLAK
jgi:SDR family mycofactocin-dependent oxidoreductase